VDPRRHPLLLALPLVFALTAAALVLLLAAWLRSAEYDEQYTLFVTAGVARPAWPADAFPAGEVHRLQAGRSSLAAIARDLRVTDVHPPLYFWVIAAWRGLVGDSLFAARLASVLSSLAALGLVAAIARTARIPPATAVLLTVGSYGFAYTGTTARGFALAQLLTMAGMALLLRAQRDANWAIALAAGGLLGAATFANYLAAFACIAALAWLTQTVIANRRRSNLRRCVAPLLAMTVGLAAWLPADLWFFLAQRQSRAGQFAPFDVVSSVVRLARYLAANMVGGLPLYASDAAATVVAVALAALLVSLAGLTIWRWRHIATPGSRLLLALSAAAPPLGLLVLGLTFDSTPIELRYLAFATPFIALLWAGAFATLPRRMGRALCGVVLAVQALALGGLIIRPETMQPARATAASATALAGDDIVLLPHGNDGVGIVGAFAIEAPPSLRLLVVRKEASPEQIRVWAGSYHRVVLALLAQDAASRATLPVMREAFADPCWRPAGEGFNALAFERICRGATPR
jgi:hypothetical protein